MTRSTDDDDMPPTLEDARDELVDAVMRARDAGLTADEVADALRASLEDVERLSGGE